MTSKVWVSWENHRRSQVLSNEFGCKYFPLVIEGKRYFRYPLLSVWTLYLIFKERPTHLFCQNPSVVLAALCAGLRPILGYKLIIDRHSNFKIDKRDSEALAWRFFHALSDFSIRNSDLNIVTNAYLEQLVRNKDGNAVVLPDKIPDLGDNHKKPEFLDQCQTSKVVCVTMFDEDEPIRELIEAACYLQNEVTLFFTGNYRKMYTENQKCEIEKSGVHFCGFVNESDYLGALLHADVIVVLTKKDYILNCGAYEALAMEKPLILSKTPTLTSYFGDGPIYVDPKDSKKISGAIKIALRNKKNIQNQVAMRKESLRKDWVMRFDKVQLLIN